MNSLFYRIIFFIGLALIIAAGVMLVEYVWYKIKYPGDKKLE